MPLSQWKTITTRLCGRGSVRWHQRLRFFSEGVLKCPQHLFWTQCDAGEARGTRASLFSLVCTRISAPTNAKCWRLSSIVLSPCVKWALERCIVVGEGARPSADERFLLDMLVAPHLTRQRLVCAREVATVLRCALYSTRIMMTLVLDEMRDSHARDETVPESQAFSPSSHTIACWDQQYAH